MRKYRCSICGYIHDESTGTKWEDLGGSYVCPKCRAPKPLFDLIEKTDKPAPNVKETAAGVSDSNHVNDKHHKELSAEEISAICSSLAKGCEKQRLNSEMEAFQKIADYFKRKSVSEKGKTLNDAALLNEALLVQATQKLNDDITTRYPEANNTAKANADRGALRSLVWSEKVSLMMKSLLDRFAEEGEAILADTKIYVCDICGFIYLGDSPPEICPVCKVPAHKIFQVERR